MIPAMAYISETCRLYIAVLFIFSAGGKALVFQEFQRTVTDGGYLPPRIGRYVAFAVIGGEAFAASLAWIGGTWAKIGMSLALLLTLIFTGFVLTVLVQGRSLLCNCFGHSDEALSPLDLFRNALLTTACIVYLLHGQPTLPISFVPYLMLLAMATIAFLISTNLKGIEGILRSG